MNNKYKEIMDFITNDIFMVILGLLLIFNFSFLNEFISPILFTIQFIIYFYMGYYYIYKRDYTLNSKR